MELETDRLRLRYWRDEDLEPFSAMGADPRVMAFFPQLNSREECAKHIAIFRERFQTHGFCLWALERKEDDAFIGCAGLNKPGFTTHFTPCIEVGWRLAFNYWGNGYATEAALASLDYAFHDLAAEEVVAFTAKINSRSRRVMERLRMTYDPVDDFDHPAILDGSILRRHVLYRVRARKPVE